MTCTVQFYLLPLPKQPNKGLLGSLPVKYPKESREAPLWEVGLSPGESGCLDAAGYSSSCLATVVPTVVRQLRIGLYISCLNFIECEH